jgi:drug/metabolite transporter (DMT)-like permease
MIQKSSWEASDSESIPKHGATWMGVFYIFLGSIFFSAKAILAKLTYLEGLTGIEALTLRVSFAFPFYLGSLLWILWRKKYSAKIEPGQILLVIFYGFLGYYLASLFDFLGLQYITASLERLVLFVYPTFVVILNFLFFGARIGKWEILALITSYTGISFAYLHDLELGGEKTELGAALVLLSALTYALYLMGSGNLIPKLGTNLFTSIAMLTACLFIFIHYSLFYEWNRFLEFSGKVYLYGVFLGVFTTVVPSYLISAGIHIIGSSRSSIIASIGPVSTIFLAYIFLGEEFGLYQMIGTGLVLLGVLMIGKAKKKEIVRG